MQDPKQCIVCQRSEVKPCIALLPVFGDGVGGSCGRLLWRAGGRMGCPSGAGSCVRSLYVSFRRSRCGFCGYVEAGGGSSYKETPLPLQPLPTLPIPSLFRKKRKENPSLNTVERTEKGRRRGEEGRKRWGAGGGTEGKVAGRRCRGDGESEVRTEEY